MVFTYNPNHDGGECTTDFQIPYACLPLVVAVCTSVFSLLLWIVQSVLMTDDLLLYQSPPWVHFWRPAPAHTRTIHHHTRPFIRDYFKVKSAPARAP